MVTPRKPIGVWMLVPSGDPWLFRKERTLAAALVTARTLRTGRAYRVWIAPPDPRVAFRPRASRIPA